MIVSIELPWPPASLLPNRKRASHWSDYRADEAKYKENCYWLTKAAMGRKRFAGVPAMELHFYPPDARTRDDDGMEGAFKHGRDGIAQALRLDDNVFRPTRTIHQPHRPAGKIIVILREGDE